MDDKDKAAEFVRDISEWALETQNPNKAIHRLAILINGVGSAIAHSITIAANDNDEGALHDGEMWITSPKDIVEAMLDKGVLIDKDRLADSFGGFQVYRELEDMFNLPDYEEPE